MNIRKLLKWGIVVFFIFILAILYKTFNPEGSVYFPKCPFKLLTGLECSGCGSQRAVHYLLNFEIYKAAKENVILVLSIPYIFTGLVFDSIKNPTHNVLDWRKLLFGRNAIFVILMIIIVFSILRNLI